MTVEHVHVHAGGHAVVGTIERTGGGVRSELEEQPRAKQRCHAPEPTMRSLDTARVPVPVASDGVRPLPEHGGTSPVAPRSPERAQPRALYPMKRLPNGATLPRSFAQFGT